MKFKTPSVLHFLYIPSYRHYLLDKLVLKEAVTSYTGRLRDEPLCTRLTIAGERNLWRKWMRDFIESNRYAWHGVTRQPSWWRRCLDSRDDSPWGSFCCSGHLQSVINLLLLLLGMTTKEYRLWSFCPLCKSPIAWSYNPLSGFYPFF